MIKLLRFSGITSFSHKVSSLYFQPRLLAVLILGIISGLPRALAASTLSVWLIESNISLSAIGMFALVSVPYSLKFLWSPLVDGLPIPLFSKMLGKRRAWIFLVQLFLMASLLALGWCNPLQNLWWLALFALLVAIFSATQDIVIDAYRVEILPLTEQAAGAAMAVLGYRLGMIISGAGALFLATAYGWTATYMVMALIVPIAWVAMLVAGEPALSDKGVAGRGQKNWIREYIIEPFVDFVQRDGWFAILLFILLYKLGDAFMGVMTNPFLIQLGFAKDQIATVVKLYGVIATIIGSLIGGALAARIGIIRTLWICGIAHAFTNLMFVAQARIGANTEFLAFSISLENISGGMGTAAFVAFISGLVNKRFTATQYALLSSISSLGLTVFSTPAGFVAEKLGWEWFFIFSVLLAFPALMVLYLLKKRKII
jgi:PAT family beta-lactamase induction signal transducer AmpG